MNNYIVLTVLFAVFYSNSANVMQSGPSKHKDFPNQCYVEYEGYNVGKHNPIGVCREIQCNSDFSYSIYGCGTVGAPEGYHNDYDLTKPYPDCCGDLVKD